MKPMRKIDLLVKYWSFKTLWMVSSNTFYSLLQIDNIKCGLSLLLVSRLPLRDFLWVL